MFDNNNNRIKVTYKLIIDGFDTVFLLSKYFRKFIYFRKIKIVNM